MYTLVEDLAIWTDLHLCHNNILWFGRLYDCLTPSPWLVLRAFLSLISPDYRDQDSPSMGKRWGGYVTNPVSDKCYRQERTAMLLSLFLGVFGVDQFYAHHWVLAVFKLLTLGGLGAWALADVVMWIVGGIYGTPDCLGGSGSWRY